MTKTRKIARIHQAPTGRWHVTDDALDYLDEGGKGYASERDAIRAIRAEGDYTHRVAKNGKVVKI
jgi:hypothetical protein